MSCFTALSTMVCEFLVLSLNSITRRDPQITSFSSFSKIYDLQLTLPKAQTDPDICVYGLTGSRGIAGTDIYCGIGYELISPLVHDPPKATYIAAVRSTDVMRLVTLVHELMVC